MPIAKSDSELQHALSTLNAYIDSHNLRHTAEREEIVAFLHTHPGHFDADELFAMMKDEGLSISRMSVYNTLELLVKCQLAVRHHFGGGAAKYEKLSPSGQHFHRICTQCGAVKEFTDKKLLRALMKKEFTAFTPSAFSFYVYGTCKNCMKKQQNNQPTKTNKDKS